MKYGAQLLVVLFLGLVTAVAQASGVLVDVKGKVDVIAPEGASAPGKIGAELPDGSEVSVGDGGSASVMLISGAIDQLASGTKYKVGESTAIAKRTNLGAGLTVAMRELAAKGERPTVHGMVKEAIGPSRQVKFRGAGILGIMAREPAGTMIRLGNKIKFAWDENPPMDWKRPALVLDDANRSHLVVKPLEERSHEVSIDAVEAKLRKGSSYSWYLATEEGGLKGKSMRFEFRTMSSAAEKEMDSSVGRIRALDMSEDGKNLLIAGIYFGAGLNLESAELLSALVQKNDAPYAKKLLGLARSRMGRE